MNLEEQSVSEIGNSLHFKMGLEEKTIGRLGRISREYRVLFVCFYFLLLFFVLKERGASVILAGSVHRGLG